MSAVVKDHLHQVEEVPADGVLPTLQGGEVTETFEEEGSSHQVVAADLELGSDVGSDDVDPKFLAAVMGHLMGADLTKEGAYLAGVIGALTVTGARATQWQIGALLGVIMDGVTDADAAVVAVIDGSDPSSETRANAAFAARMNNANEDSGVDYGLDLHDPGRGALYSDTGKALAIAKAIVRSPLEVCWLEGDGAPTDGGAGTGAGFAGKGSLYVDVGSGDHYRNTGTKASPTWETP